MLALLGGVHVHRVLAEDARSAVHHEEILTLLHTELLRKDGVLDVGDLHEVEEMVARGAEDARAELREKEEERGDDVLHVSR